MSEDGRTGIGSHFIHGTFMSSIESWGKHVKMTFEREILAYCPLCKGESQLVVLKCQFQSFSGNYEVLSFESGLISRKVCAPIP